jgi:hypothetical protein
MKFRRHLAPALLMVAALSMAADASAEKLIAKENRTFNVGTGSNLVLDNQNGSVTVTAWDRPQIQIEAEKSARAGSEAKAKEALQKLRVEMSQNGNTVEVRTRSNQPDGFWSWMTSNQVDHQVTYRVMVPRNCNLNVETVNGGVKIEGVSGTLKLETTNGGIRTTGTSGSVNAGTTNGGIEVELLQAQASPMSLETTNGKIVIRVPATFRANLDASTTNGSIRSDLPVTVSGQINRRSLRGALNGGGPELELETTNGSIQILKGGA